MQQSVLQFDDIKLLLLKASHITMLMERPSWNWITTRAYSSLWLTEPLTKVEEEIGRLNTTKKICLGEIIGKLSEWIAPSLGNGGEFRIQPRRCEQDDS
jgi:hypothetical protein